ncbi:hypothetical protein SCHPADRAFT_904133 [Schizopora paradoxa]|uniref:Uncharacterized protein n=1 Tax=Schizopora paradoxa TaxID=27342 RepID=A0A0H2RPM0_9AGAM|nr:hypothetical protein SCHPADRAFT_904133 [Schizopora paradoxa]
MALTRQRLVTLVYDDMETVRMLPSTFADLEVLARDWVKPPPDAHFSLRVPVEYASFQAARYVNGPYIWITSEDSYQIAILGVQGSRVEILSDAPPPVEEPPPPPPPPVLEMDGIFNLELEKGKMVGIDVTISSDELDMARMEDGTTVAGVFWGKLDVVHDGDLHKMEFSGTRLQDANYNPDMLVDQRVISKLTTAAKPTFAKCSLSILSPVQQYCEVNVSFSSLWKVGLTWPPAENVTDDKFKYFVRVHPGGALEHFESESVVTSIYYEAIPDQTMFEPSSLVPPYNSFAMSFREFVPHITRILEQLGLSLQARTNFITNNMPAFSAHKNIAYRFMSPGRLARAIDISVTHDACVWTRIFLLFRGLTDDDMVDFVSSGEKEALQMNWREIIGWQEQSKDPSQFRVLEVSVLECT